MTVPCTAITTSALSLASVHLLFKAGIPSWQTSAIVALAPDWTRFVRQASFVALMTIVLLALNRNIPYSIWRWWHRLSGPLFLVVVMHWLSIKSPIELGSWAGLWLAALSSLAVMAATYKLLLYSLVARHGHYRVVKISRGPAAAEIELEPVGHRARFRAGHFGFLRMRAEGLREPHPFTIASAPAPEGRISFVIRALGDYTTKLIATVQPGMHADVYAPYGRFERKPTCAREIWIGGGVGISPFIAWMRDDPAGRFDQVTLFYFYTPGRVFPDVTMDRHDHVATDMQLARRTAVTSLTTGLAAADATILAAARSRRAHLLTYDSDFAGIPDVTVLEAMARERGIEFVPIATGPGSEDFVQHFAEIVRNADVRSLDIALCGPKGLLNAVRRNASGLGVRKDLIRHELFAFR